MSHRFPPLSPPVKVLARTTARTGNTLRFTFADLCLAAALVLCLALALI